MLTPILKAPSHAQAEPVVPAIDTFSAQPTMLDELSIRQSIEAEVTAKVRAEMDLQLNAKLADLRQKAHEEGFKAGFEEGHQEGQQLAEESWQAKLQALDQLLERAEQQLKDWVGTVEDAAFARAKEAITEFLGEQALDEHLLQLILERTTHKLKPQDVLKVRMHPADANHLRGQLKTVAHQPRIHEFIERLVGDPSLSAGGLVVETPRGEYQATLPHLLNKMVQYLDEQRQAFLTSAASCHALRA